MNITIISITIITIIIINGLLHFSAHAYMAIMRLRVCLGSRIGRTRLAW